MLIMSMLMGINERLSTYFQSTTSAAPLAVFRIFFGILMLTSLIRFAALGWIEKLYLEPSFHFTFYGFGWVKPLGGYTYLLFVLCGLAALMITLGYRYRLAVAVFFCSFTYIELMDKTTYLNHYYFVSVMSFLLFFLPAATYYSLDARRKSESVPLVPRWSIDAVKLLLAIVYFYAGLAKLNSDWLLEAKPLRIWLATKDSIPLIGSLLKETWVAYAFSWSGALYDLFIPFLLWYRPTRGLAFVAVVIFHLLTRILFPIGMFPYIMIVSTLIFFGPAVHERILRAITRLGERLGMVLRSVYRAAEQRFLSISRRGAETQREVRKNLRRGTAGQSPQRFFERWVPRAILKATRQAHHEEHTALPSTQSGDAIATHPSTSQPWRNKLTLGALTCFFALQLLIPFRYQLYPGELFWTEQGFRFSWRVMLMEKAGYAQFKIVEGDSGRQFYVDNSEFLNPFQEKQMAFQPDFILEYAHYLAETYRERGLKSPQVYVESYVALNGRGSQPFVDPTVDLAQVEISLKHKNWLLPFSDGEKINIPVFDFLKFSK